MIKRDHPEAGNEAPVKLSKCTVTQITKSGATNAPGMTPYKEYVEVEFFNEDTGLPGRLVLTMDHDTIVDSSLYVVEERGKFHRTG